MNKSKSEHPVRYGIRVWGYQEMKLWVFYGVGGINREYIGGEVLLTPHDVV